MRLPLKPMLEKLIEEEARAFSRMLVRPEAREAFTAFFERRKPDWSQFS
jgi:1,4-dihydroxy-2-naphthoyl-CoA synthase